MRPLKQVLMDKFEISSKDAQEWINETKERVEEGEDPEDLLLEEFGLEPDYIFDLLY